MSVHYKFKSNLDHDTVTFDGLNISVADLKKSIMHQKKIGKSSDFDLQITNAQTKEVYDNDEMLVPKNTSVIVARVPVQGGSKKNWDRDKPDLPLPNDDDDLGHIRYDRIVKNADLVNANTSEEDKVKAMITQSSQEYDPSKYVKSRSMTGPLPPCYTCFRCGKQGHWIKNCPTNNPDVKRSTGIPRSFMVPVDGPEHKGALLTSSGDYAVPLIDHQAYKEVKKEKPPFVPQDEPVVEPEAKVPEELLCMVCKDLMQDAVLIPCCGNSFCDECVRQVLLESDNHECPVCHEIDVSPNTLIPIRFLRTAVLNYKNETGYTRVKKEVFVKSPPRVDSPQPSPDSTVESQSNTETPTTTQTEATPNTEEEKKDVKPTVEADKPEEKLSVAVSQPSDNSPPKQTSDDESVDAQPGTPLADENPVDLINQNPIQAIGKDACQPDKYENRSSSRYSYSHRDDYKRYHYPEESLEPQPISTIGTITNIRKKFVARPPFPIQRSQRDDARSDSYSRDRDDYHGRYDKHHPDRGPRRVMHYDRLRDSRYPIVARDYPHQERDVDYGEDSSRRHQERYRSSPQNPLIPPPGVPPSTVVYAPPVAAVPPPLPPPPPHAVLLPPTSVFPPQPPPPGASPINTSQPPPPGVGPLLTTPADLSSHFSSRPYESEDPLKEPTKVVERSIDDRMEEFQRKLEKQDRKYARKRGSRSRSRSVGRHRSRSSSRSRSFSTSKSWSHSPSRSSTRTSRSRSRTPYSNRSRTRSYSHSRSRSWSKRRSYTRSRSRTRAGSRSRSRSRIESRMRRRGMSRDRMRSPRHRSRSRSYSPKHYPLPVHRSSSYSTKPNFNPPHYPAGAPYQPQYGPPPAILPMGPMMRPPLFPQQNIHAMHAPIQTIHSRPIEKYPMQKSSKYQSYGEHYPTYDIYERQRYDRERPGEHRLQRYDKKHEYQKIPEEVTHRIPGWVGDRSREYKQRYRQGKDVPRSKEIRELPQITEEEMRSTHSKDHSVEASTKKKEEKVATKHKKHHHHHKSKEAKKHESKTGTEATTDENSVSKETKMEKQRGGSSSLESEGKVDKKSEKLKEKKHKHKKHKTAEGALKKKKLIKKEKTEGVPSTDSDLPVKLKNKKKKVKPKVPKEKPVEAALNKETSDLPTITEEPKIEPEEEESVSANVPEQVVEKSTEEQDVLDIFADDAADLNSEMIAEKDAAVETALPSTADAGNVEESDNSEEEEEEEIEEPVENENVLRVDVPGISKWEREDSEDEPSSAPIRRSSITVVKSEKDSISSDIISRAENVLLSKQFKPRVGTKEASDSKDSSEASSPEIHATKHKETIELKSVVNSEQLKPDTLQVTISNHKDKRLVYSRKDEHRSSKSESLQPKWSRSDRAGRHHEEAHHHRRNERDKEPRKRVLEHRDRRASPVKEIATKRPPSTDSSRRTAENRESGHIRRDERRHRGDDHHSTHEKPDRKKITVEPVSHIRKPLKREIVYHSSKPDKPRKSRSLSYESMDSISLSKKRIERGRLAATEKSRETTMIDRPETTSRRKYSPINPPSPSPPVLRRTSKRESADELKFEPNYDEFSDVEEKNQELKARHKRKAASPEVIRKSAKLERNAKAETSVKVHRTERSSATSSVSSSAESDSDSSDLEEEKGGKNRSSDTDHKQKHKKPKHKKHRKHKHKHKKKKSHKSKRE